MGRGRGTVHGRGHVRFERDRSIGQGTDLE
jgi:hypothetical protein